MYGTLDFSELFKRFIKYIIEGLCVAIVAYSIPSRSLKLDEIALISLVAAATFAILQVLVSVLVLTLLVSPPLLNFKHLMI